MSSTSVTQVVIQQQPTQQSAQLLVPVEGTRDWSTGLCGCFSDLCSCIATCCCLCATVSRVGTRMGECYLMPCCVPGAIIPMRTRVRTMGGIRGSICNDYCAALCCYPLVVCQMSRELDNMGL